MPSLVAERRPRAKARKKTPVRPPEPWWGKGEAPHVRWPGVTITLDVKWTGARWETADGRHYFDPDAAGFAEGFFPLFLRHHIGEFDGQEFELLDYQRYIVRTAWGWKRASDGYRRFRKVFLAVPKGNGKSPFGSGCGLLLALFDREPGAEVYAAAADKKQAGVVFDTAKIMVEKSPELGELCEVFRDSIKRRGGTEFYQVLSSDAPTKHGFRPHGIVFDEFHAQPNRDLYDTLYRGTGKRRQPMTLMITTAGDDDESVCYEEWDYARRVISGSIEDETYLPVIFEVTDKDDWTSPEVWRRVNPGYGITIKEDYFIAESRAAQNEPRKRNSFLQLHTNRWVNQATSWIPVEWWDDCKSDPFSDAHLATLRCAAGLDMAQKIDLAAFVVTFQEFLPGPPVTLEVTTETEEGQEEKRELSLNFRLYTLPFFWLPEATVRDREREGFTSYRSWAEAGLLTITDGASIDYDRVLRDITNKIVPRFPLLRQGVIGYDPAFATDIAAKLRDKAGLITAEVLQNYKQMTEPCHVFEALVKEKRVVHDGNRLLRWNVENVAVKRDEAGRIRPVKPKKATKKIDGVVATLMGLNGVMSAPPPMDEPQIRVFGA